MISNHCVTAMIIDKPTLQRNIIWKRDVTYLKAIICHLINGKNKVSFMIGKEYISLTAPFHALKSNRGDNCILVSQVYSFSSHFEGCLHFLKKD